MMHLNLWSGVWNDAGKTVWERENVAYTVSGYLDNHFAHEVAELVMAMDFMLTEEFES